MSHLTQKAEECAKRAAAAMTDGERVRQLALEETWQRLHRVERWLDRQVSPFARPHGRDLSHAEPEPEPERAAR